MEDGICSKRYPKVFSSVTKSSEDGYPVYRRREDQIYVTKTITQPHGVKEEIPLDNRWVVPYNPYLTALFNCHINVEICNSVKAVKYLYKYVFKGHDRVTAEIRHKEQQQEAPNKPDSPPELIDEIAKYVDGRYVTPQEACWRIFHYSLHDNSPAIQRLQLHLENQQQVIFKEGHAEESLENTKDTHLMAWFKINQKDPKARSVLYTNFPEYYTWHPQSAEWRPRKSGNTIGRMYTACSSQGERFYLRLLLTHLPG